MKSRKGSNPENQGRLFLNLQFLPFQSLLPEEELLRFCPLPHSLIILVTALQDSQGSRLQRDMENVGLTQL